MHWEIKKIDELSGKEMYEILNLRNEVFVLEQNCPYLDTDQKDIDAIHVMGYQNNKLIAYCRLLAPGVSYTSASIGRVVTAKSHRRTGAGKTLMKKAVENTFTIFNCNEITISAQLYLKKFYESFGFITVGEVYLEDDIDHIKMILKK